MEGYIRVLGPLAIEGFAADAGTNPGSLGRTQRRLLAMLCAQPGSVVSVDRLREGLGVTSDASVRSAVSRVRGFVGDAVRQVAPGYLIDAAAVDSQRFVDLLAEAGASEPAEAISLYDAALLLWRGSAYEEFADEEWAMGAAGWLNEARVTAREDRVQALISSGLFGAASTDAKWLAAEFPLRERPRWLLMNSLASDGRRTEALRVFNDFSRFLSEEVGVEPSDELRGLDQAIAAGEVTATGSALSSATSQTIDAEDGRGDPGTTGFPSGVVTFLFTDVVGSTRLWASDSDAMSTSLSVHDSLLREAIESNGGYVFSRAGDSFSAAFTRASDAVKAASEAQASLKVTDWPGPPLAVRMGLHLGEAEERDDDYFGSVVNLAARLESAGHGGQVLVTNAVRQAAAIEGRNLGTFTLPDVKHAVQVFQVGPGEFPPLRSAGPSSTNLPTAATTLIGRVEQVQTTRQELRSSRLLTLVAAGGTGKTRLALAVGSEELPERADGVWFVDLTAVAEPEQLEPAIATAMDLSLGAGDVTERILEFLSDKDLLLVLDNCEHLVDACAEFAEAFLASPGQSQILATSRERLDIDGEQALQIPPLSAIDVDSPAVQLFIERATAVRSDFAVDDHGRDAIVQLCERLDGSPLAIELAAARSSVLSPTELLAGIGDRFQILHGGRRRQRQRTLEATLDWSYNLLDPAEQQALRSLGVFVGTFDLDAAASVIDMSRLAATDLIESLVAKSLVDRVAIDGVSRFRLFETTAAYAQQSLTAADESETAGDRHFGHYHEVNAQRDVASLFWDFGALDVFEHDRSNILAAFEWAAARGRWRAAGELLFGTLRLLMVDDVGALRLIDRTMEALDAPDDPLVLQLHESRLVVAIVAADYETCLASVSALRQSPQPFSRLMGTVIAGFLAASVDPVRALTRLDTAALELPQLQPGPEASRGQRCHKAIREVIWLFDNRIEAALESADAVLAEWDGVSEDEGAAQAARNAAICYLVLNQPEAALAVVERGGFIRSNFGTMDFHVALCHIALGELEQAEKLMDGLARRSASGRIRLEAGSMLLVLAALANAEHDQMNARRLLLTTPARRSAELIVFERHLADLLDVRSECDTMGTEYLGRSLDSKRRHHRDCIAVVQAERARRGWTI